MTGKEILQEINSLIERLEESIEGNQDTRTTRRTIIKHLMSCTVQAGYVIRDEKILAAKGQEYFEAKEKITPKTKLKK
jgi:hypothetical protein